MENVNVILFLCVCVPILPVLFLLPDSRPHQFLGFLLCGSAVCLVAAELNTILLEAFGGDMIYVTTNITPVSEEILKSLPILFFAWAVTDKRDRILSASFALGLGFAMLENQIILTQNLRAVTIPWAFARGLGAAMMHSFCTAIVGAGICYVRKRRKLFFCGTFSLLVTAIIYHAIFNSLIQSRFRYVAFFLPTSLFILLILYRARYRAKAQKS